MENSVIDAVLTNRIATRILFCMLAWIGTCSVGPAQTKYNPDDDSVRQLVEPMVAFVRPRARSGGIGHRALMALAISESTKRYEGYVPKEDPIVVEACEEIVKAIELDGWQDGGVDFGTMYGPCLCLILLCDTDAKKYGHEIRALLDFIDKRQRDHGPWGYRHELTIGDTSQVQYVALAIWVANKHGFDVKPRWGRGLLDWLAKYQRTANQDPTGDGGFGYKDQGGRNATVSLTAAGSSSTYLIADWFGLNPQAPNSNKRKRKDALELPRDVKPFVKDSVKKTNPVIEYDRSKLKNIKKRAADWFERNFTVAPEQWNYYFLYAFERYAYFREASEGPLTGKLENWYDQGVERIKATLARENDGSMGTPQGPVAEANRAVTTALSILFLVRSTEILDLGTQKGMLVPQKGFGEGDLKKRGNRIIGTDIAKTTEDLMTLIDDPKNEEDLDRLAESYQTIRVAGDSESKAAQLGFLRSLVTHKKFGPRYVGVKYLANQRDMANVPSLIYALSDPDVRIAKMAHNGLRFISRKVDTISVPANATQQDYLQAKVQWERWYLSVNPKGRLLDK